MLLTQNALWIHFTWSGLHHFLNNSILYNLIWDFDTYIPREVERFHLCFKSFRPSARPGIPLLFVTTEIQNMLLGYFKYCLLSELFLEYTSPFSEVSLHLFSLALILVLVYFVNKLHLLLANYFFCVYHAQLWKAEKIFQSYFLIPAGLLIISNISPSWISLLDSRLLYPSVYSMSPFF